MCFGLFVVSYYFQGCELKVGWKMEQRMRAINLKPITMIEKIHFDSPFGNVLEIQMEHLVIEHP
jgi:hypothetical protein